MHWSVGLKQGIGKW